MENTFPAALVEKINGLKVENVTAEFVKLGGVKMAEAGGYRVIIDRISQDIPFYRAYLKNAALTGTIVINNPFWWTADDKFFNYALASKLGVAIPPTVILPHNKHPEGTTDQSMRNLMFPLNWDEIFEYVGFPAFLNPAPDAEITSVGQANFEWIVEAVAELAVKKALSDENPARELRWAGFLKGGDLDGGKVEKPAPRKRRA